MSKYGVFSGPYFPVFGLDTEIQGMSAIWDVRYWEVSLHLFLKRKGTESVTFRGGVFQLLSDTIIMLNNE